MNSSKNGQGPRSRQVIQLSSQTDHCSSQKKRTVKSEGLGDLERVTLDTCPLDTCQEKEKTKKSYTKQKYCHPTGWCTGRHHLDGLLIGCNRALWLGVGGGQRQA